ncbi:MAG: ABC transporter ATP-binding protein [Chloroflexota bacterium]
MTRTTKTRRRLRTSGTARSSERRADDGGGRSAQIELRGLSRSYGATVALDNVSATVEPGEMLFVLGPSGAGKSTLLRIVGGYEQPDEGDLLFDGASVLRVPVHKRDIGMVFQSYALFPHMRVLDNVAFGLKMRGVGRAERVDRARWALSLVRLEGVEQRFPRQLSGGQQQRVALARALAYHPSLLLLDEPLSNLDRRLRDEMRVELRQLQQRLGVTTIVVTHDQEESLAMADRVLVLNRGQVQQVDSPSRLYHEPVNAFVAGFIGEMNLLSGTVVQSEEGRALVRVGGVTIEGRDPGAVRAGERVLVGLRAERIQVGGSPARAEATVRHVSFLGASLLCIAELDGGEVLRAFVNDPTGRSPVRLGERVALSWDQDAPFVVPGDA